MIYKCKIISSDVRGTIAVITAKPTRKALRFIPGQYASVGFMNGWRPSPMHCFSIIGGLEDGTIRFAVRISGPFTQALSNLEVGDELLVRGPFGNFYMDEYDKRAVLIASGIGITPFLSMLQRPSNAPITLLYSNRSARDIPFRDELISRAEENTNVQIGFFASDDIGADSQVISGRISERYVQKVTSGAYAGSTYFICGPGSFTQQIQPLLENAGVLSDKIVCESFTQKTRRATDMYRGIRRVTYGLSAATLVALTAGIMVLDLSRAVPKLASSKTNTAQAATSTTAQTAKDTTSGSTSSSSNGTSASSSNNTSVATTQPTTTAQTPSTYQQPVSSVS